MPKATKNLKLMFTSQATELMAKYVSLGKDENAFKTWAQSIGITEVQAFEIFATLDLWCNQNSGDCLALEKQKTVIMVQWDAGFGNNLAIRGSQPKMAGSGPGNNDCPIDATAVSESNWSQYETWIQGRSSLDGQAADGQGLSTDNLVSNNQKLFIGTFLSDISSSAPNDLSKSIKLH